MNLSSMHHFRRSMSGVALFCVFLSTACSPGESVATSTGGRGAATGGNSGGGGTGGAGTGTGGITAGSGGNLGSGGGLGSGGSGSGSGGSVGSGGSGTGGAADASGGSGSGGMSATGGTSSGGATASGGASATGGTGVGGGGGTTAAGTGGRGGSVGATGGAGGGGSGVVSLFDGTTLSGWLPSSGTGQGNAPNSWNVLDNALHCTGMVRGSLISAKDYGNFRLIFHVRQLPSTGSDNHYASVLIWGTRPPPNDAIGGLQFGVPNGYYWDYRPGHNNNGAAYFDATSGGFSRTAWSQCEILTNVTTGVARMACCNLGTATSCRAREVLKFTDLTAGRRGPIALQAHSVGAHDQYKNITIEENPAVDDLLTIR